MSVHITIAISMATGCLIGICIGWLGKTVAPQVEGDDTLIGEGMLSHDQQGGCYHRAWIVLGSVQQQTSAKLLPLIRRAKEQLKPLGGDASEAIETLELAEEMAD